MTLKRVSDSENQILILKQFMDTAESTELSEVELGLKQKLYEKGTNDLHKNHFHMFLYDWKNSFHR